MALEDDIVKAALDKPEIALPEVVDVGQPIGTDDTQPSVMPNAGTGGDITISKIQAMAGMIAQLKAIIADLQDRLDEAYNQNAALGEALTLANGRIAVLEACVDNAAQIMMS